jgi:hypothetical protein
MRFLEQTLTHGGHSLFVFSDLLWNTNKHAKLWWKVDVLALLLDLEKWLVKTHDLFIILLAEIVDHRNRLSGFSLFKAACLRTHIPTNCANFISLVVSVASHHDSMLEFIINSLLNFVLFWRLAGVTLAFLGETDHLFIN